MGGDRFAVCSRCSTIVSAAWGHGSCKLWHHHEEGHIWYMDWHYTLEEAQIAAEAWSKSRATSGIGTPEVQ